MYRVLFAFFLFIISGKNSLACKLKTHFAREKIRKSCVSLKSQANALTFVFLSGIILSQSIIAAYTFVNSTTQEMPFSDAMVTPTGFAVGVPEQAEDSLATQEEADVPQSEPALEEVPVGAIDGSETPETDLPSTGDSDSVDGGQEPGSDEQEDTLSEEVAEEIGEPQAPGAEDSEASEDAQEAAPSGETESPVEEEPLQETPAVADDPAPANLTGPQEVPGAKTSEISIPVLPGEPNETQEINETLDEPGNITISPEPPENDSIPDSLPEIPIPSFEEAELGLALALPSDIKRGDTFTLVVRVSNAGSGTANNIVVEPILPGGASATETSATIDSLASGQSFEVEFTIVLSYETLLGENEIKVRVSYE